MRPVSVTALAALASLAMVAFAPTPAAAFERPAKPASATSLVTRVADTAAPKRRMAPPPRRSRFQGPWFETFYWRERMAANRWVHYQYVNAGYPVRHCPCGVYTTW
jgi:hypothetical protein